MNLKRIFGFDAIAFKLVMMFAIIGACMSAIAIHELIHKYDYQKVNFEKIDEEICIMNFPTTFGELFNTKSSAGYYHYSYYQSNMTNQTREEYKEVEKYSEVKAYTLTILILAGFLIAWMSVVYKNMRENSQEDWEEYEKQYGNKQ